MAVDALLEGREEDLATIGEALEEAWEEFDQNGDRLASNQETSQGVARLDEQVAPQGHRLGYGLFATRTASAGSWRPTLPTCRKRWRVIRSSIPYS